MIFLDHGIRFIVLSVFNLWFETLSVVFGMFKNHVLAPVKVRKSPTDDPR